MTDRVLRRRIKLWTWVFIAGLVISGATAIPLVSEIDALTRVFGISENSQSAMASWLLKVQTALHGVSNNYPFLFYGTDWLAFGHFVIAIAFIGPLLDPVRNKWIFSFGVIASVLVIPYALIFGMIRGIPFWWRLIDCSFGVLGVIPLGLARKAVQQLEQLQQLQ